MPRSSSSARPSSRRTAELDGERRQETASEGRESRTSAAKGSEPADSAEEIAADLSFRQAQAALELALAQLQDTDLDVELMADLHRRALAYADRCEALLQRVEQEVMQWDPARPDDPASPLTAP